MMNIISPEFAAIQEERYQLVLMLKALKKKDPVRCSGFSAFNPSFLSAVFKSLLSVPAFTKLFSLDASGELENMLLKENRLYSDFYMTGYSYIGIWDMSGMECLATWDEPEYEFVQCVLRRGDIVYSSHLRSSVVRLWDKNTYEAIGTIEHESDGENDYVTELVIHEYTLYCGCESGTIRLWDLRSLECVSELKGHTRPVLCLVLHEDFLYSGGDEGTIKIWDLKSNKCVATLKVDNFRWSCFLVRDNMLYNCESGGGMRVWDVSNPSKPACVAISGELPRVIVCMLFHDNLMYSGTWDGRIVVLEFRKSELGLECVTVATLKVQDCDIEENEMKRLEIYDNVLYSSCEYTVEQWKLR